MCCLWISVSVFSPGAGLERWGKKKCGSEQTRVPRYRICTCGIWTLEFIAKQKKALFLADTVVEVAVRRNSPKFSVANCETR